MNISTPFIKRPIATSLLMVGIFLAGLAAYPLLPVAALPQVDFPTISVSASLPGASPETMSSSVATPLERQFGAIPGVTDLTSSSVLGNTSITVQFDLNRDIDSAAQDIQQAINAAAGQLPKNLPNPPTYRKVNPADSPIMIIAAYSDVLPITTVNDYADNILTQQLSQLSGVGNVAIGGQQKPAVRIQIDPDKIAALGLSLDEVRTTMLAATVDAPKGSIDGDKRSFTIYNNDQLTNAAQWNDVIVLYRDGSPVRIRDIGQAVDAAENMRLAGWANEKRGVFLVIFKQPGANVIDTVAEIRAALPRLRAAIPPSVKVDIVSDRTQTIKASVEDVQITLLITIALVVMVIFLFLRNFWATAIPSVTVPLALMATLGVMYMFGYSLDNLSLMGLVIAVGFVVDDAIVMVENIYRHMEEGMSPMQAALKGAGEIGFTIISISLSLVAVFIPLLLMGGIIGRLFREFAMTVTIAVLVSAFVSLTLTPMMGARLLKPEHAVRHGRLYAITERGFQLLIGTYERALDTALRHRFITLCVFFMTVAISVTLFIYIPKGFFPQQDTGFIVGTSEAAPDISYAEMVRRTQAVAAVVAKDPDVDTFTYAVGAVGGAQTGNTGRFFISLKPRGERTASADQIIRRLRAPLSKVEGIVLYLQAAQDINVGGRISRTQYQYTLQDADLDELNVWAPKMLAKLRSLPQLQDVASDLQLNATTATLTIDRDQASRFGILPQLIDDTLYDAFGQRQVAQYFTQTNTYRVILEVLPELQGSPSTLERLYIKSPLTGEQVPLTAFVKYTTRPVSYLSINHQGQFPAVTLSFNLAPNVALGDAVNAIQQAENEMGKPATLVGSFQGSAKAFQSSLASQPYLIAGALIVVYIILGMLYESYIHPLTIISTLPSAGVGALLMLLSNHFDLSVIAMIGIILLIGIVKKNGIMMVDFAIHAEREKGLAPEEAIRQACLLRFRPIMMTTMAALFGGLPLMLGNGTGAELRQPLGYAMVGGLIVSQALTLFTTPVVYIYLDKFQTWLRRGHGAAEAPAAGED